MEFPFSVVIQWLSDFLLPLVRISSMIMIMAGLGAQNVPTRIKMGLAVEVTFLVVPALPPATFTNLFSFEMVLLLYHVSWRNLVINLSTKILVIQIDM